MIRSGSSAAVLMMMPFACDYIMSCVFFFFQAEDGIRDLTVTGVQTCALPILPVGGDLLDPGAETAQPFDHRLVFGDLGVAAHDERQRILHPAKSRGDLHQPADRKSVV